MEGVIPPRRQPPPLEACQKSAHAKFRLRAVLLCPSEHGTLDRGVQERVLRRTRQRVQIHDQQLAHDPGHAVSVTPENRPQVPSAGAPEMRVIEKELC